MPWRHLQICTLWLFGPQQSLLWWFTQVYNTLARNLSLTTQPNEWGVYICKMSMGDQIWPSQGSKLTRVPHTSQTIRVGAQHTNDQSLLGQWWNLRESSANGLLCAMATHLIWQSDPAPKYVCSRTRSRMPKLFRAYCCVIVPNFWLCLDFSKLRCHKMIFHYNTAFLLWKIILFHSKHVSIFLACSFLGAS